MDSQSLIVISTVALALFTLVLVVFTGGLWWAACQQIRLASTPKLSVFSYRINRSIVLAVKNTSSHSCHDLRIEIDPPLSRLDGSPARTTLEGHVFSVLGPGQEINCHWDFDDRERIGHPLPGGIVNHRVIATGSSKPGGKVDVIAESLVSLSSFFSSGGLWSDASVAYEQVKALRDVARQFKNN